VRCARGGGLKQRQQPAGVHRGVSACCHMRWRATTACCCPNTTRGRSRLLHQAPYLDEVVKVYCVHTEPNYSLPWQVRVRGGFGPQQRARARHAGDAFARCSTPDRAPHRACCGAPRARRVGGRCAAAQAAVHEHEHGLCGVAEGPLAAHQRTQRGLPHPGAARRTGAVG
jgi:hypothetical protein